MAAGLLATMLARHFAVSGPNCVWAGDLTALPTAQGWLYLAVLLDLWSRRVVGWALRATLETELVTAAWQMAVGRRQAVPHLHHSDRGAQTRINDCSRAITCVAV